MFNQLNVGNSKANTLAIDQSRQLEIIREHHHAQVNVLGQRLQQGQFDTANAQAVADQQFYLCSQARQTGECFDRARIDASLDAEQAREALRIQQAQGTSATLAANEHIKFLTSQLEAERQLAHLKQ